MRLALRPRNTNVVFTVGRCSIARMDRTIDVRSGSSSDIALSNRPLHFQLSCLNNGRDSLAGGYAIWQWSNLIGNSQTLAQLGAAGAFPGGPVTISTTVKDYASIRGRLGIAFDCFLVFGTGGWAWGNPSTSYALAGAAPFVTNGTDSTGWTVGAGVDYAFTDSVFGRIEYRSAYPERDTLPQCNFGRAKMDSEPLRQRLPC